jgi:hypothetical protein
MRPEWETTGILRAISILEAFESIFMDPHDRVLFAISTEDPGNMVATIMLSGNLPTGHKCQILSLRLLTALIRPCDYAVTWSMRGRHTHDLMEGELNLEHKKTGHEIMEARMLLAQEAEFVGGPAPFILRLLMDQRDANLREV